MSNRIPVKRSGPRFIVKGDVVTDTTTGLMWTRGNVGEGRLNWRAAKEACKTLKLGGHDDWRLPTLQELVALADYSRTSPAIDPVFQCDCAWYWTGTPYAGSPSDYAWIVNFNYGGSGAYFRSYGYHVRAVRAGQMVGSLGRAK